MLDADLIIKADHVLTMDPSLTAFERGAIAVLDGKIAAVGPYEEITRKYRASKKVYGEGLVALPGFVNTHTHAAMVYFRGLGDDLPLKVWLEEHIWPAEGKWLSPEFVSDAAELACLEMLKAGITLYSDMYFFGDAVAATTKRLGMRAVVGAGIVDFPTKTSTGPDELLAKAEDFASRWKGDPLIVPAVAPHSPYACSPATLKKAKALADRNGTPLHIHLAETQWEVGELRDKYGTTPVELMEKTGVLDRNVVAAHCVWVTDAEIALLAKRGTAVAHCIESNLKLGSGIAPVLKMLGAGVKVTFGTDGAASNNDLNILSELSTAAKVHKAISGDPSALNARQALLMATRHGAEALGLGALCGSLEPGKSADVVLADIRRPHLVPLYDIYSHIVYAMSAADISTVVVNGRVLLEKRKYMAGNEADILERANAWGSRIRNSDRSTR